MNNIPGRVGTQVPADTRFCTPTGHNKIEDLRKLMNWLKVKACKIEKEKTYYSLPPPEVKLHWG